MRIRRAIILAALLALLAVQPVVAKNDDPPSPRITPIGCAADGSFRWSVELDGPAPIDPNPYLFDTSEDGRTWTLFTGPLDRFQADASRADVLTGGDQLWVRWDYDPKNKTGPVTNPDACQPPAPPPPTPTPTSTATPTPRATPTAPTPRPTPTPTPQSTPTTTPGRIPTPTPRITPPPRAGATPSGQVLGAVGSPPPSVEPSASPAAIAELAAQTPIVPAVSVASPSSDLAGWIVLAALFLLVLLAVSEVRRTLLRQHD